MTTVICFWVSFGMLAYIYLGYPLAARLLARFIGRDVKRAEIRPSVTFVITAYNEQTAIRAKLDNVLGVEYPEGLLDVLVVSDASDDATDEIVRSCGLHRVRLLRVEGRRGKTACQNAAVTQARGDIVVFTDATTTIDSRALLHMVANFADPEVGCVAGSLTYQRRTESATAAGGTAYWGYEISLRTAESRLGTLVGVSGCLYAVRRAAYRPIAPELISDFVIATRLRAQGLRTILEPGATCFEATLDRPGQELAMRVRVALRSIAALAVERKSLNPLRDPIFAWQLWSHKLLRYASPYFLAVAVVSSAMLWDRPLYRAACVAQLAIIAAGFAGLVLQRYSMNIGVLGKPCYFLLTNVASLLATIRFARGERIVTWSPVR